MWVLLVPLHLVLDHTDTGRSEYTEYKQTGGLFVLYVCYIRQIVISIIPPPDLNNLLHVII
jgi:hypothetical protein